MSNPREEHLSLGTQVFLWDDIKNVVKTIVSKNITRLWPGGLGVMGGGEGETELNVWMSASDAYIFDLFIKTSIKEWLPLVNIVVDSLSVHCVNVYTSQQYRAKLMYKIFTIHTYHCPLIQQTYLDWKLARRAC